MEKIELDNTAIEIKNKYDVLECLYLLESYTTVKLKNKQNLLDFSPSNYTRYLLITDNNVTYTTYIKDKTTNIITLNEFKKLIFDNTKQNKIKEQKETQIEQQINNNHEMELKPFQIKNTLNRPPLTVTPELISYHNYDILNRAIKNDNMYIASTEQKDATSETFGLSMVLTDRRSAYVISEYGMNQIYWDEHNNEITKTYQYIPVIKPKIEIRNSKIYSCYNIIEEGRIEPNNKKDIFKFLRLSKPFEFKSKLKLKYKNPVDKFPFEILYNIFLDGKLFIPDKHDCQQLEIELEKRNESYSSYGHIKHNVEACLIPLIGSWITQNPVIKNRRKLFVEMPSFIEEQLQTVISVERARYNTYEIVTTAIKLKKFYEQFYK